MPRSFVPSMRAGCGNDSDALWLNPAKELATGLERAHRSLSMSPKEIKNFRLDTQSLHGTRDRFLPRLEISAT